MVGNGLGSVFQLFGPAVKSGLHFSKFLLLTLTVSIKRLAPFGDLPLGFQLQIFGLGFGFRLRLLQESGRGAVRLALGADCAGSEDHPSHPTAKTCAKNSSK